MNDSDITEEFIGRFGVSFKDGENIYAYDEITHGLYKFALGLRKVNMVISPESIHRNVADRIMGISKSGNEIILIPLFLDSNWIIYNEIEKKIRYEPVGETGIRISSVITIEKNVFLIPSHVHDPVVIVSLERMKVIKTYENWHGNVVNNDMLIWGASFYRNFVFFPVVDSKKMVCVNYDKINVIEPDIPDPILSVSVYEDRIWILPVSGKYIYATNYNGETVEKIELFKDNFGISASRFCRIVATEGTVFLFPNFNESLCVYQFKRKQFLQIATGGTALYGKILLSLTVPSYWDFVVDKEILHLLPSGYRYKSIHISSLECKEHGFKYGENINNEKYWKMVQYTQKNSIDEKYKSDLREFFQYIFFTCDKNLKECKKENGKKIWTNMIETN